MAVAREEGNYRAREGTGRERGRRAAGEGEDEGQQLWRMRASPSATQRASLFGTHSSLYPERRASTWVSIRVSSNVGRFLVDLRKANDLDQGIGNLALHFSYSSVSILNRKP
jgi:hypothetical protein